MALMWNAQLQSKPQPYGDSHGFVIQPHDDAAKNEAQWKGELKLLIIIIFFALGSKNPKG